MNRYSTPPGPKTRLIFLVFSLYLTHQFEHILRNRVGESVNSQVTFTSGMDAK